MKRFYKLVSVEKKPEGYAILLDGRPIKTPLKNNLCAPNEALANLIVQEWANQGDKILPETMPIMQILNTQLEKVASEREELHGEVTKFFNTDLLCYRADESEPIHQLQTKVWQTHLDWFEKTFGQALETTTAIAALKHPQELHDKIDSHIRAMDDAHFTILQLVTPLTGSIILALQFTAGQASAEDLMRACYVEEDHKDLVYNAEKYGHDPLTEKKKTATRRDLEAAEKYLSTML